MTTPGIDYGLGRSNIDKATGIRYGVISMGSIMPEATDDFVPDYGYATCPKCGDPVTEELPENWRELELESYTEHGCDDYFCGACKLLLDSGDVFSEESMGFSYEKDGYKLTNCLETDIFVLKSPYYTRAQFCSPCVPGAGNLDTPCETGPITYCLGHDWFDGGKAPYPVYRISDGAVVEPEDQDGNKG